MLACPWSSNPVRTAIYAAKQYTHEARDGTSLNLELRLVVWSCKSSSWSCRAILSSRRSHISTNSPLQMLCTSRYEMGSAAGDIMRPDRGLGVKAREKLTGVKSGTRGTAPKGPLDPSDVGGMAGVAPSDDQDVTSSPNNDHDVTSGTEAIASE